jgi:hypothetical protein
MAPGWEACPYCGASLAAAAEPQASEGPARATEPLAPESATGLTEPPASESAAVPTELLASDTVAADLPEPPTIRNCPVCGRPAEEGWALCPQCGASLAAPSAGAVEPKRADLPPIVENSATRATFGRATRSTFGSTIAATVGPATGAEARRTPRAKTGLAAGIFVGAFAGIGFIAATSVPPRIDMTTALGLALFGTAFLVLAVLLGLAAYVSGFFPSFGVAFCYVCGIAVFVSLVISAFQWNAAGVVAWVSWLVQLIAAYFIIKGISIRMVRRRQRQGSTPLDAR